MTTKLYITLIEVDYFLNIRLVHKKRSFFESNVSVYPYLYILYKCIYLIKYMYLHLNLFICAPIH